MQISEFQVQDLANLAIAQVEKVVASIQGPAIFCVK